MGWFFVLYTCLTKRHDMLFKMTYFTDFMKFVGGFAFILGSALLLLHLFTGPVL